VYQVKSSQVKSSQVRQQLPSNTGGSRSTYVKTIQDLHTFKHLTSCSLHLTHLS
jgi:hypothetical protein